MHRSKAHLSGSAHCALGARTVVLRARAGHGLPCLALLGLMALAAGCATTRYVEVRTVPRGPLVDRLKLTSYEGPQPTERTMQILRQYDLTRNLREHRSDPRMVIDKLQAFTDQSPSVEKLYALAEMNYLGAEQVEARDEDMALDLYGAAVANAYLYLFDERFATVRNPYDPEFRGACDVYNGALESVLRIVRGARRAFAWPDARDRIGISALEPHRRCQRRPLAARRLRALRVCLGL